MIQNACKKLLYRTQFTGDWRLDFVAWICQSTISGKLEARSSD